MARRIRGVPLWVFHGAADDRVTPAHARAIVEALQAAGGEPRYTEFPGAGHDIWDRVYSDRAFWRWLLAQRLPAPATQPVSP
ncbi:MAG: hypothetical protein D6744_06010 [Planctomycetota bacterium]|nr:MAG: hypothetical protein D6744_06010 [Planctomycetota bacterium]